MIQLLQANANRIPLPDGVVSLCVTSPPYFSLRDYNVIGQIGLEKTPEEYIAHLVEVFAEVRSVLTPDGLCFVNLGDSYASSGKSGATSNKATWHGGGDYDDLKLGRAPSPPGIPAKNLCLIPQRAALAFQADGWWVRSFMPWPKNNALPESVRDRPTTSHEYWIMLAKSKRYFWDGEAVRVGSTGQTGQAASFARLTKETRTPSNTQKQHRENRADGIDTGTRNRRTADTWLDGLDVMIEQQTRRLAELDEMTNKAAAHLSHLMDIQDGTGMLTDQDGEAMALRFNTASFKGAHFATFPAKMIVPLVKAGSSERGVCPVCRAAWRRVVERGNLVIHGTNTRPSERIKVDEHNFDAWARPGGLGATQIPGASYERTTTGWRPTCPHYPRLAEWPTYPRQVDGESDADYAARREPIRQKRAELLAHWEPMETSPAIVLDTFVGSGTTLEVTRALKRDGIGLDLSRPYLAEQARKRLGLTALAEWETGIKASGDPLTGLPMFARMK